MATRPAKLSTTDVQAQLARVITDDDEVVVIYSGIWMLGSLFGLPVKDVPKFLMDAICEFVGPQRTILWPAFTYNYARTRVYDPQLSKPETGVLPVHAVSRPEFARTLSPLNSYAVLGPRATEVLAIEDETLWGDESVMGWIDEVNARICVLGEPWHEACTHFHRAEEKLQVPYRYYKKFPGMLHENGQPVRALDPSMYVRDLQTKLEYSKVAPVMEHHGSILKGSSGEFPIESALARDVVRATSDLLEQDPIALVVNKKEALAWIRANNPEHWPKLSNYDA